MKEITLHKVRNSIKLLTLAVILTLLIITQTGCGSKAAEPVSKTDYCLNTTCTISIYNMSESDANLALDEAFGVIKKQENILSKTVKGSDVYNINHASGQFVRVDKETVDLIKMAMQIGDISGGKFDITTGAISEMWDFTGENPHVPAEADIENSLPAVDYHNIIIEGNKVKLGDVNAQMDLGGIAKGYIADVVTKNLQDNGVTSAIVNLGGNVVTIGEKTEGTPFVIGIERPYSDRTEIVGSVESSDMTLVTSGIYERKFTEGGKLYHHVLDPATGYPAVTDLEAVTIVADKGNSAFCDGLSTTCLILGEDKAKALVGHLQKEYPKMHIEASFINNTDKVAWTEGMNIELSKGSEE